MLSFVSNNIEAQKISILNTKQPTLKWIDNSIYLYYSGFNVIDGCNDKPKQTAIIYDTKKNLIHRNELNSTNFVGCYSFSQDQVKENYYLVFKAVDSCGQVDSVSYFLELNKVPKPRMSCISGLSLDLMPMTGEVWTVPQQYYQDKTNGKELPTDLRIDAVFIMEQFSLTPPIDKMISIGCTGIVPLRIWAKYPDGNWETCDTYVDVQNNMGATPKNNNCNQVCSLPGYYIKGNIKSVNNKIIFNAIVKIKSSSLAIGALNYKTLKDTTYRVLLSPISNLEVTTSKNDDPLNGVSTYDLILLNRHILGNQVITDKYALIAADINKNGKITTSDAVELRKMVLGTQKAFNNNDSWRFFNNQMLENVKIDLLRKDTIINFTGVKIGDINGNANAASAPRALQTIHFDIEDKTLNDGELYTLTLGGIDGFGFTLNYDTEKLELLSLDENSALLENGAITTAQVNSEFKAIFRTKANILLSKALIINSNITKAEAVVNDELFDLVLNFKHQNVSFELFQNQPNPFRGETKIAFMLPEANQATIKIFNQNGQIVKQIEGFYEKGYNELKINDFSTSGIYFYQLETSTHHAMKKLIILD
jgi:hypothetical protein